MLPSSQTSPTTAINITNVKSQMKKESTKMPQMPDSQSPIVAEEDEGLRMSPKGNQNTPAALDEYKDIEVVMVIEKETPTIKIDVTSDGAVEGFEDQMGSHEDGLDRNFHSSGIFLGTNPAEIDTMIETDPI